MSSNPLPATMARFCQSMKLLIGAKVLFTGRLGHLMGFANELTQIGTASFFYPQDMYSNRLGVNFFNSYGPLINQNPSMISTYMYWFLMNPNNINLPPININWEIGPKY